MVQDADGQNCRCRLNISSESASATACGRAFQVGMVRGRNAYLNASTAGWKRWNCLGWPLAELCGRGTGWYSCGTSTSTFVILYIIVSLLWSLRVCRGSHPRSDTIADTERGGLLRRKGIYSSQIGLLDVVSFPVYQYIFAGRLGPEQERQSQKPEIRLDNVSTTLIALVDSTAIWEAGNWTGKNQRKSKRS